MPFNNKHIYFDHNATTYAYPQAVEVAHKLMAQPCNASSLHSYGKQSKKILEDSRQSILQNLNANSDEYSLIFTASATEANNIILNSFEHRSSSQIEHPSVANAFEFSDISASKEGVINLNSVENFCAQQQHEALLSVIAVSNEIGTIQPIAEIAEITHKHAVYLHTDATQALGKIKLNLADLNADAITISSHKAGGIIGAAALIVKKELVNKLKPLCFGGGQELRIRPGTENVPAIAAFAKAVELSQVDAENSSIRIQKLRDCLEEEILKICPKVKIIGKNATRVSNTSGFNMPNVQSSTQVMYFDMNGIAIGAGSACSNGLIKTSHVLMSLGIGEEEANEFIRVSLGRNNTLEEVNSFIKIWKELYELNNPSQGQNTINLN